jgi:hypothetical protein
VSFWIKTTDTGVNLAYAGTPQLPVLGNDSGSIGFGLGVDGGKAAYRRYSGGWYSASGVANVANGVGPFVTFVAVGSSNLNIYVDGVADALNLSVPGTGSSQLAANVGSSYLNHYGAFTVDDIRIYDNALTAAQVHELFGAPEPAAMSLLAVGALILRRCRRQ